LRAAGAMTKTGLYKETRMYSQCPECQTRFRVTADVLRIAQGTVRCGRCGSAFNALTRLSDSPSGISPGRADDPADLAGTASNLRKGHGNHRNTDVRPSEFHFSAEDIERVFVDADAWQRQFGTDPHGVAGFDAPASSSAGGVAPASETGDDSEPLVEVNEDEGFEDITLEGERVVIEGLPDFLIDSSEHELADAELLEAQADARTRLLPDRDTAEQQPKAADAGAIAAAASIDETMLIDAAHAESLAGDVPPQPDLDSTDRFEVLGHVPDSAYPEIEHDDAYVSPAARAARDNSVLEGSAAPSFEPDIRDGAPRAGEKLPRVVAAAVAGHTTAQGDASGTQAASRPSVMATAAGLSTSPQAAPSLGDLRSSARRTPTTTVARPGRIESPSAFEAEEFDDETPAGRRRSWIWGAGALLLAITLLAQAAHVYRHELGRDPKVGPALRNLYGRLGMPLAPTWDLGAYELRQWGATDTQPTGGFMTVRASIKNRAAFAQPLPLLRLELEDRFGGVIGRRDFEPKEYLRDPAQASRLLAAGAATEAELELADTTQEAVGYRLDLCIRDAGAAIRCAQGKAR
jgi:predicted Zn finger-like uncharacterized protein